MTLDDIFSKTGVFVSWVIYLTGADPKLSTTASLASLWAVLSAPLSQKPVFLSQDLEDCPRKIFNYFIIGQESLKILNRNHFSVFHLKNNSTDAFLEEKEVVW